MEEIPKYSKERKSSGRSIGRNHDEQIKWEILDPSTKRGYDACKQGYQDLQREYRMENSGMERHVRGDLRVVAMLSVTCQTRIPFEDNIVVC